MAAGAAILARRACLRNTLRRIDAAHADLLALSVLVAFAGGLVLYPPILWAVQSYAGLLPMLLWFLARRPLAATARQIAAEPILLAGLGLLVWSLLTLIWGRDDTHRSATWVLDTCCTGGLLLAGFLCLQRDAALAPRIAWWLAVLGAANAGFSLLRQALAGDIGTRLNGFAAAHHPILGAGVMITCLLCALWLLLEGRISRWMWLGLPVMAAFVIATGSRGPMGALCAATLALLACYPRHWQRVALALGAVMVAGGLAALLFPALPGLAAAALAARPSKRGYIWQFSLERIAERPILGHGLAARLGDAEFTFPHDLYLSLLFYSGAVGLALFLLMLGLIMRKWRRGGTAEAPLLLALVVNALVNGISDLGQVSKGPSPLWYMLWLPVMLAAGLRVGKRGAA